MLCGLQAAAFAACSSPPSSSSTHGGTGGGGAAGDGGESALGGSGGGSENQGGAGGGEGGDAGIGGAGGEAAIKIFPPLELPEEFAWLDDPETWTLLPQPEVWSERCYMREADPDRLQFPPLDWEPCGDGCSRTDVVQGYGSDAARPKLGVAPTEGVPHAFLHFSSGVWIDPRARLLGLQRIVGLNHGKTIAAAQYARRLKEGEFAACGSGNLLETPFKYDAFLSRESPLGSLSIEGNWNRSSQRWDWKLPWPPASESTTFPYCFRAGTEAGGRTMFFCGNVLRGSLEPGSSSIEIIDRPGDDGFWVMRGSGYSDIIAWSEVSKEKPGSRVRAWRPDGKGVRTMLEDIPLDTCGVGVSETRVAGFSALNACDSMQHEGRVWIATRTADDDLVDFKVGPVFWPKGVVMFEPPHVWGDFVAVGWAEQEYEDLADRQRLLLVRTTDWAMRDLRGPDGMEVWNASLTDEHLYVVFTQTGPKVGRFSHVYRYDLDKFDQIGKPLEPVAPR